MNKRERNKQVFEDTRKLCETNQHLVEAIQSSNERQKVISESKDIIRKVLSKYGTPANIVISKKRTLEAASGYPDQKVCIHNFASATNPGGGVEKGSNAQEECICRCSTLYFNLTAEEPMHKFYLMHRGKLEPMYENGGIEASERMDTFYRLNNGKITPLYNDDCIYTPDVVVFKTDTDEPELMPEKDWYNVNVITCAAPNLRQKPSNEMNPCSGDKAVKINNNDLLELHKKRLEKILGIAVYNRNDVVILGAFGCGAFQNPPDIVAEATMEAIKEYLYAFKTIELAVYCPPGNTENYDIFARKVNQFKRRIVLSPTSVISSLIH